MPKNIEILLVDQAEEVRFGIRKLLARCELSVAAEASFGTEAVNRALQISPDVILCALEEPLARPLETIDALLNALPATPIVVYSSSVDIQFARKAMLAGARDFLVRPFTAEAVESTVLAVLGSEEEKRLRLSGRRRAIGTRATLVAIFSAKGGVGKTTFATHIGAALASDVGQSVAVIDADTSFGDVTVTMNLQSGPDLAQLIQEMSANPEPDLKRYLLEHPSGARILPPPRNPLEWNYIDPESFGSVLELVRRSHEYVIVDLSPAPTPITLHVLEAASIILWLVTPEIPALKDNIEALEVMRDRGIPTDKVRFVLNHAHSPKSDVSVHGIEAAIEAPIYWSIPHDRDLYRRSQLGQAGARVGKYGPGGRSILSLARSIAGVSTNGVHRSPLSWLKTPLGFRREQEVTRDYPL